MADKKITELTNITGANLADADEFVVVDSSASETKAITWAELKSGLDTSTGFVRVTGDTMTGNLNLGDNNKAIFGAGSDLQIFHDGSNSYIKDAGTGTLRIQSSSSILLEGVNGDNFLEGVENGAVYISYDGSTKLATTSTGVDVTGTVMADGLTVDGNATVQGAAVTIDMMETDTTDLNTRFQLAGNLFTIRTLNDAKSSGTDRVRLNMSTGDFYLYEDTGTTPKFFWDASAEALGIGTSSPALQSAGQGLHIHGATNSEIKFTNTTTGSAATDGTALVANGSNFTINNREAGNLQFNTSNTERMRIDSSGRVGIGTGSPNAILTVNGGSVDYTSSATGTGLFHVLGGASSIYAAYIGVADDGVRFGHNGSSRALIFDVNETERMRIDSSGNVGIGTSSPSFPLDVDAVSGQFAANFTGTTTGFIRVTNDTGYADVGSTGNNMLLRTNGTERMRIDSVGNLLVGRTTVLNNGTISVTGDSKQAITAIVTNNANSLFQGFNSASSAVFQVTGNGTIQHAATLYPFTDAAVNIGTSAARYNSLYLSGDGYFGKTTTAAFNTTVGVAIQGPAGYINACRSGGPSAYLNRTTSTGELVALMYDGVTKGNISVSASAASFNTTSDYRLKENVVDLTGAADRIKQIPVHRFNFIADPDAIVDGFLAHEVQEIVPEAVTGTKDAMRTEEYEVTPAVLDDEGNVVTEAVMGTREVPEYQGIDHSKLVPLLTAALQEALTEIANLKARVAALEA